MTPARHDEAIPGRASAPQLSLPTRTTRHSGAAATFWLIRSFIGGCDSLQSIGSGPCTKVPPGSGAIGAVGEMADMDDEPAQVPLPIAQIQQP